MQLGLQLKKYLVQHNLKVSDLSLRSGIPKKTIYHWLNGQRPRNIEQVKRMADCLQLSVDALVFGSDPAPLTNFLSLSQQSPDSTVPNLLQQHQDEIFAGQFEVVLRRIK